jgi:hypothetical protein
MCYYFCNVRTNSSTYIDSNYNYYKFLQGLFLPLIPVTSPQVNVGTLSQVAPIEIKPRTQFQLLLLLLLILSYGWNKS